MIRHAVISPCGLYRYLLSREWDGGLPKLVFVMLNPSTADAEVDDPTIRKCIGFAQRNGYGGIVVVNLFAYRATDPKVLRLMEHRADLVGPLNDAYIAGAAANSSVVVCLAWGANARRYPQRVARVTQLIGPRPAIALRRLSDGTPAHPLMLPYSCELKVYRP